MAKLITQLEEDFILKYFGFSKPLTKNALLSAAKADNKALNELFDIFKKPDDEGTIAFDAFCTHIENSNALDNAIINLDTFMLHFISVEEAGSITPDIYIAQIKLLRAYIKYKNLTEYTKNIAEEESIKIKGKTYKFFQRNESKDVLRIKMGTYYFYLLLSWNPVVKNTGGVAKCSNSSGSLYLLGFSFITNDKVIYCGKNETKVGVKKPIFSNEELLSNCKIPQTKIIQLSKDFTYNDHNGVGKITSINHSVFNSTAGISQNGNSHDLSKGQIMMVQNAAYMISEAIRFVDIERSVFEYLLDTYDQYNGVRVVNEIDTEPNYIFNDWANNGYKVPVLGETNRKNFLLEENTLIESSYK